MAKRGIHISELWRKENTVSENYLNQAFLITALSLGFLTSGFNQITPVSESTYIKSSLNSQHIWGD